MLILKTREELLSGLIERCREIRLQQNLTQQDIAERTGIPLSTYRHFEQNGQISLERFIAVVQALNRLTELEQFLQPAPVSDLRQLDQQQPQRKRARKKR